MIKYLMMLMILFVGINVSAKELRTNNSFTDYELVLITDVNNMSSQVADIQAYKAAGKKVVVVTAFLWNVTPGVVVTSDCNHYGETQTKNVGHYAAKPNWLSLSTQMMQADPVMWDVDLFYLSDEVNNLCVNINDLTTISDTYDSFGLRVSAGYAIQEAGVGPYIPANIHIPTMWNYADWDPGNPFDPMSYSNISIYDIATQLNGRPVVWVVPNFCENWRHANKYGWVSNCSEADTLAEVTMNQFAWAISEPQVEIINVFGGQGGISMNIVDKLSELVSSGVCQ